ncbi:hypothetical protein ACFL5G_02825 [Candidatus Margulisiibacteriota bacterium]
MMQHKVIAGKAEHITKLSATTSALANKSNAELADLFIYLANDLYGMLNKKLRLSSMEMAFGNKTSLNLNAFSPSELQKACTLLLLLAPLELCASAYDRFKDIFDVGGLHLDCISLGHMDDFKGFINFFKNASIEVIPKGDRQGLVDLYERSLTGPDAKLLSYLKKILAPNTYGMCDSVEEQVLGKPCKAKVFQKDQVGASINKLFGKSSQRPSSALLKEL